MPIKNSNNIIFYTHSMYIAKNKNGTKFILPMAQPLLNELENKGFNIKWFLRGSSKIYNNKTKKYTSPLNSKLHYLVFYIDTLYKISINKFLPKKWSKILISPFLEYTYWLFIIFLIKPKLIIGIEPSLELCRAGKLFNITSIDIEHGLRDETSYFFRKDYRFRNDGYPSIILFSDIENSKIIKNFIPNHIQIKLSGFLEIIHFQKVIFKEYKKDNIFFNNAILFISQYKKRGSYEPKQIPKELIEIIDKNNLKLVIRVHPKLAQNEKLFKETIDFYYKNLDKKIQFLEDKIIFTNPYEVSIWEDIIKTIGLITQNSASFRFAQLLKKPVLIYSNELEKFESEGNFKNIYGFTNNLEKSEWEKFIKICLTSKKITYKEINEIINKEVRKMNLLVRDLESEIANDQEN